ncbi:kinase-like domain-containing protein [Rhizophagus clarus]|uniref:Kinase-like domain-containing protein n=1 Tax=Rhizophagus clarus TaxID=94130 RepID=A0A8H3MHH1_9GLOM|nr:kinase-like domain-containing protein [Rhizophagus clarus]
MVLEKFIVQNGKIHLSIFALNSLLNIEKDTKELFLEIELQCEVTFHNNVISFYRITISDQANQNTIKLTDFGLSKRVEASTKKKKDLFGCRRTFMGDFKCFYVEEELYDGSLAIQIMQGLREKIISDTPIAYFKLYTKCWDDNPDNRLPINDVFEKLNDIINQKQDENLDRTTNQIENKNTMNSVEESSHGKLSKMIQNFDKMNINQTPNENIIMNNVKEESHGELSQINNDFDKMNTEEIMESRTSTSSSQNILPENYLSIKVNEIMEFIYEVLNKRDLLNLKQKVFDYINSENINLKETYDWLCNNQNYNSNLIFLRGYFDLYGIVTSEDYKKAFNLFINASEQDHILAQYFVGWCYLYGLGTPKDYKLAFECFEKVANKIVQSDS